MNQRTLDPKFRLVSLTSTYLNEILRLAGLTYSPDFFESVESFQWKLLASQGCSYGIVCDERLIAYIVALPWLSELDIPLNISSALPNGDPDVIYIHDLSVDPGYRREGLGRVLVNLVLNRGTELGLKKFKLVAVQNSTSYWDKLGFSGTDPAPASYGVGAISMRMEL